MKSGSRRNRNGRSAARRRWSSRLNEERFPEEPQPVGAITTAPDDTASMKSGSRRNRNLYMGEPRTPAGGLVPQ